MAVATETSTTKPTPVTDLVDAKAKPVKDIKGTNGTNGIGSPMMNGANGTASIKAPVTSFDALTMRSDFIPIDSRREAIALKPNQRIYTVSDPVRSITFEKCHGPFPFPNTLKEVISWTDAYVDRIAWMVEKQEKDDLKTSKLIAKLQGQLEDSKAKQEKAEKTTEEWRNKHAAAIAAKRTLEFEKKQVDEQLCNKNKEIASLTKSLKAEQTAHMKAVDAKDTFKRLSETYQKKKDELIKELSKFKKEDELEDEAFRKRIKELQAALKKEHDDHTADHDALGVVNRQLEEERCAKKQALVNLEKEQKKVQDLEKQVTELRGSRDDLQKKLDKALAEKSTLEMQVKEKDGNIAEFKKAIEMKDQEIKDLKSKLESKDAAYVSITLRFEALNKSYDDLKKKSEDNKNAAKKLEQIRNAGCWLQDQHCSHGCYRAIKGCQ